MLQHGDIVDLLEELARLNVKLKPKPGGNIAADAPAGVLQTVADDLHAHKLWILWALKSWPSHTWRRCPQCHQCMLIPADVSERRCPLTPKCQGRLSRQVSAWRPGGDP